MYASDSDGTSSVFLYPLWLPINNLFRCHEWSAGVFYMFFIYGLSLHLWPVWRHNYENSRKIDIARRGYIYCTQNLNCFILVFHYSFPTHLQREILNKIELSKWLGQPLCWRTSSVEWHWETPSANEAHLKPNKPATMKS